VYKPNPFSIAKINAAARAAREPVTKSAVTHDTTTTRDEDENKTRDTRRPATASQPILEGFRKQAKQRPPRQESHRIQHKPPAIVSEAGTQHTPALINQDNSNICARPTRPSAAFPSRSPGQFLSSPIRPQSFVRPPLTPVNRRPAITSSPIRHTEQHTPVFSNSKSRPRNAGKPLHVSNIPMSRTTDFPSTNYKPPFKQLVQPVERPTSQSPATRRMAPASSFAPSPEIIAPATKKFPFAASSAYTYNSKKLPHSSRYSQRSISPLPQKRSLADAYDTLKPDENENWSTLDATRKPRNQCVLSL
jgi:hypothetical protein